MQRYTLTYQTKGGVAVTLYNLGPAAVSDVERAQTGLGSTGFTKTLQPHNYSQHELDRLRAGGAL